MVQTFSFDITELHTLEGIAKALLKDLDDMPYTIVLEGSLGTGKTTFVQLFLQAIGYTEHVPSPSYGLVNSYTIRGLHIAHADFYRLEDDESLDLLGWDLILRNSDLVLIEWPKAFNIPWDIKLHFDIKKQKRYLTITTYQTLNHLNDLRQA